MAPIALAGRPAKGHLGMEDGGRKGDDPQGRRED
jgi:hypothetical protein